MSAPALALALADLELYDPHSPPRAGHERRFCCPLCGDGHPQDAAHRSVSANMDTGAWHCHRCDGRGLLREFWTGRPRETAGRSLCPGARRGIPLPGVTLRQKRTPAPPPPQADPAAGNWQQDLGTLCALSGTPGAAYLSEVRGIPPALASSCGVRFTEAAGRHPAAVVFPLRDLEGNPVAAQRRYLRPVSLKAYNHGPTGAGLFATPGALAAPCVIITEAPIDALSLAACGYPALAVCGTYLREWLLPALAMRTVLLAFDADDAGDKAARQWAAALSGRGATCHRLRPGPAAKDWNELLTVRGAESLRKSLAERLTPLISAQSSRGKAPTMPVQRVNDNEADNKPPVPVPAPLALPDAEECTKSETDTAPAAVIPCAEDLLTPYRALIDAARAGALPAGPIRIGPAVTVTDPALCVLSAAREIEACCTPERQAPSCASLWRAVTAERLTSLDRMARECGYLAAAVVQMPPPAGD